MQGPSGCAAGQPKTCPVAVCVDCPSHRVGAFEEQVGGSSSQCRFVKASVAARAPLPPGWSDRYAFALVRRGVMVRTRGSDHRASVAIDCAGPGAFVALPRGARELGYAATDLLVCLYERDRLEETLARDPQLARDLNLGVYAALERVERLAEARGRPRAEDRVAGVLEAVADTFSPPDRRGELPAGLSQRDLARLASVRHESFCRALKKLEQNRTISRAGGRLRVEPRPTVD